ncbi:putative leucine-rich repeat receptor-like protein kinase [Canna indica]|uniref:Leucine-rich repeat receptor-like protein kinase n=1 Tax=Canna indica TaxID=4628 RepID=A0AAQ3L1D6_9LILI|nr:putative leucine-rich repeat receptor-like protein kinase [Canna indica]
MGETKLLSSPCSAQATLLLLLALFSFSCLGTLDGDLNALLEFKAASDSAGRLTSWNRSDPSPCASWHGVTCAAGRVTRLVLEGLDLTGADGLQTVTRLDQLRVLSLKSNRLSGTIPDLSPLSALKLLFLSHNQFSGPIPASLASLGRLYRLDLGSNNLTGPVPTSLNRLSRLLTLRLNSNRLSGPISGLVLPRLQDLDLSSNLLSGAVSPSLSAFSASAFAGNPGLCGGPLPTCRDVVSDPSRPSAGAAAPVPPAAAVVVSSPSAKPEVASPRRSAAGASRGGMNRVAVVAIVVGDFAVLVLVSGLLFCYFWRKFAGKNPSRLHEGEKIVYSSSPYAVQGNAAGATTGGGFERGKMVFFEGTKRFELEDLLRASAEMLGKGGYGTAYRAVLDDSTVVAVKRLREVSVGGKREFESHMDTLGRLRHASLVPLKAYYYARDEKLLVYDYMPNGSLFFLLHGNRGPGRTPLDWTTRMRIAVGAARGLAFIHQASRSPKLTHGNIKSTNVLLDKEGNARLADAGLALLGPGAAAAGRAGGYRAPEAPSDGRRPWSSQRADIYAFGVVLLELLTGKSALDGGAAVDLPRWVQSVVREEWTAEVFDLELMRYKGIEEEMMAMLQIAMSCTSFAPDQRPKMGSVVKMIEDIRGGGAGELSPSHDSFDSVSDSASGSDAA